MRLKRRASLFVAGLTMFSGLAVIGAPAALAAHPEIEVYMACAPTGGQLLQVVPKSWSFVSTDPGNHDNVRIQMRRVNTNGNWTGWLHEIGNGKFAPSNGRRFTKNYNQSSPMADFGTLGSLVGVRVQFRVFVIDPPPTDDNWSGWYNDAGTKLLNASTGNGNVLTTSQEFVVPNCPVPPPGAKADNYGLVDPGSGKWYLRNSLGQVTSFFYGNPGDVPFMGDWNCDGVDTPGLYRQSDGYVYLRNSNTQGVADIKFFFGNPGDVPLAGDFNNNGCDTVSLYRPSEQIFYIINKLGSGDKGLGKADYFFMFGNPGDKPVVGDWDGDGIDEAGLHRESSGFFYYRNTHTTGIADGQFFFGDPGDRFVAGDWGVIDKKDTPAVFRPSNRIFYFRHTLTQGVADSQFTWSGAGSTWLPVAGAFGLDPS